METPLLKTANTAKGTAVFAETDIPEKSEISYFEGYVVLEDTQHSGTFDGVKIEPTGILRFLSHSCEPNAFFRERTLIASRGIEKGEEVTIDYMATEQSISHPFTCSCGARHCRRKIG